MEAEMKKMLPTLDERVLEQMDRLLNGVAKYRIPMKELKDDLTELVQIVYSIGGKDMLEIVSDEDSERASRMVGVREIIRKELVDEIIAMLMDQEANRLKSRNLVSPTLSPTENES